MKVIFLDHDGVICLHNNWDSRFKKQKKFISDNIDITNQNINTLKQKDKPLEIRFDDFDKGAIKVLNEILEKTDSEIVVSSDWKNFATLEELGEYYISQGIIKKPIGMTKRLGEFDISSDFVWLKDWDLEQTRCFEINQWLKENPEVQNWVAVDDLNLGTKGKRNLIEFQNDWGLKNFVNTPLSEGIKQQSIKEKILNFLI